MLETLAFVDEKLTMFIAMDFFPNKINEHSRLLGSSDYMLLHPLPLSLLWLRIIRVYNSKLLFLYVCIKYKLFQCAPSLATFALLVDAQWWI